jgi:thioredoxin-related protein
MLVMLLWNGAASSAPGVQVDYPDWFEQSFYDLQEDLQRALDAGKQGVAVFFSEKSCSYCKAMVEKTFREPDIAQRLRQSYDVVGLDVFSDVELVDPKGNSHWVKDFAILEKAQFTPTLIFYGKDGDSLLRIVGYQSPIKMRAVLGYLEGGHYTRMSLRDYINKQRLGQSSTRQTNVIDLQRDSGNTEPLLVIFESPDCQKCPQFRNMLKAPIMQPYLQQMQLAFVSSSPKQGVITPEGRSLSGKAWSDQLELLHSPSMVYFDERGKEALRVDFDILIDSEGRSIDSDDARILDNIRARLEYMVNKGYESIPQFQRWRASTKMQRPQPLP